MLIKSRLSYIFFFLCFMVSIVAHAATTPQCGVKKFSNYQIEYCLYPGQGPLLVLEAAQGNDMSVWPQQFIKGLNRFSAVLVYNRIGYGKSHYYQHPVTEAVTAKTVAQHLNALINSLKIQKPIVVVGHSIGGIYTQYFVRNYPKNVAALVLIDADSSFEPKENSPFKSKFPHEKGSIDYFESNGFNQSMDEVNHSPAFPNIPLLVITATHHGGPQKTEALWQQLQKKMAKQSPQGKQVIAQGSGHFIFRDDPALVIKNIHQLIQLIQESPHRDQSAGAAAIY